jgi:intein/homing endonuclease
MGNIILPDDPNWKQPLIMGDPFEQGLTPKSAQEKRNKEFDKQRESEGNVFKYANSAVAHHPEPWLKNAQVTGVSNMMTNPMWFSPLHTPQNWQIASKRREIYQWSYVTSDKNPCYLVNYGDFSLDDIKNVYTKWQNNFADRGKMYIQNDKGKKAKPDICTKRYVEKKANRIKVLGNPHPIEVTHDHKCIVIKREDVKCPKGISRSKNCIFQACSPTCERVKCKDYENKNYNISTINAEDVKKGDYVLCPFPTEVKESIIKTKEQARFAGHLASDGWISQNNFPITNVCMHPDETEYVLSSVSPVFESFGAVVKQESFGNNKVVVVRSGKKSLHEYSSKLVKGKNTDKHFTEEVMLLNPELQKHVLGAYIQSDGSFNKTIEQIEITTVSKHLAYQLQIMCYRNKILAFCSKQPRRQGKGSFKTTNLEYYIVSIPKTFVYTLQDYVPGKIPERIYKPQQKLGGSSGVNFIKNGKNISRIYNRFFWKNYVVTPVVSNTSFDYKGDVYDIRVPPTHAITANGIAIHQCRFFYDCFTPDNLVLMANGTEKSISQIVPGDMIVAGDGSIQQVNNVFRRWTKEKVLSIHVAGSNIPIKCTTNHRIPRVSKESWQQSCETTPSERRKRERKESFGETSLEETFDSADTLSTSSYLFTPQSSIGTGMGWDLRKCYLLGAFTAEGSYFYYNYKPTNKHTPKGVRFSINSNEIGDENKFGNRIQNYLSIFQNHKVSTTYNGNCAEIRATDKNLANEIMEFCGHGATQKSITGQFISQANKEELLSFLAGFIDGDGCYSTTMGCQIITHSDDLASQIAFICEKLGITFSTTTTNNIRKNNNFKGHNIRISRFACEILKPYSVKINNLDTNHTKFREYLFINNKLYRKVNKISESTYEGWVYDLEIDKVHSYCVNRCVVHNSEPKVAAAIDFYCFTPDTQILMSDGTQKSISSIMPGEIVRSHTGKANKVLRTFSRQSSEDILKITYAGVLCGKLKLTLGHKVLTEKNGEIKYVQAQELQVGDYLLTPCGYDAEGEWENGLVDDFAYLVGVYAAEGCGMPYEHISNRGRIISYYKGVKFAISQEEQSFCDTIVEKIKILYGDCKISLVPDKNSKKLEIRVYGRSIADDLIGICPGTSSDGTKRIIPHIIKNWNARQMASFVSGFYDGDGCYQNNAPTVGLGVCKRLLEQVANILDRLGIEYTFAKRRPTGLGRQQVYIVSIPRREMPKFTHLSAKKIIWNSYNQHFRRNWSIFKKGKYVYRAIIKIEQSPYDGALYDMEVENDHSYVVNRISVSNSRFPMNGFKLECKDPKILKFFEHKAAKRLSLNENCKMISSECHMLGDVFIHMDVECPVCQGIGVNPDSGEICNHPGGNFKKMRILNPDWIEVQQNIMADEPSIVFVPDEELKRIVFYKQPKNIYDRIPNAIKSLVLQNKPIPLSNRTTSHLKYMPVPYGTYGTSLIRRLFTTLAYKTKIMTANWIVAERLILPVRVVQIGSDDRPATSADIADVQQQLAATANDPNLTIVTHHNFKYEWYGACHDDQTEVLTDTGFKTYDQVDITKDKICIYNLEENKTECIYATDKYVYDYDGEMIHFHNRRLDILVTPNHKMLYRWSNKDSWKTEEASELKCSTRLLGAAKFEGFIKSGGSIYAKEDKYYVRIGDSSIELSKFCKFIGYYLSEGTLNNKKSNYHVAIYQNTSKECFSDIEDTMSDMGFHVTEYADNRNPDDCRFIISNKELVTFINEHFKHGSLNKTIPNWIKNLPRNYLKLIFNSMINGDGYRHPTVNTESFTYTTVSKSLADDIQEIAFKCGYSTCIRKAKKPDYKSFGKNTIYRVHISMGKFSNGSYPIVREKDITRVPYKGKVWCFTVPTGFFVTRRNGKITIQGNSGKILQITQEMEYIGKEILDGFMLNQSLLNGEMCIPETDKMLTKSGLKNLNQIDKDDEIATFNKETGMLEYQKPTEIHVYDWNDDLIHFRTDRIDFACTPNHRMLYQKRDSDKWIVDTADKVSDRVKFRKRVNWLGGEVPENVIVGDNEISVDQYVALMAYYVTEGYTRKESRTARKTYKQPISLCVYQSVKGKGYNDVCELFESLPYKYSHDEKHDSFAIHNKTLAMYLQMECGDGSYNKHLPDWVKELPRPYLQKLLRHMINGDGSIRTRDRGEPKQYYVYYTRSRQLNADILEVALKCGYWPRYRYSEKRGYELAFSDYDLNKETLPLESKKYKTITRLPYKGKVWCVTVPNGFIITERNGKLSIHSNSGYQSAQVGVETLIRRIESWRHTLAEWIQERIFKPIAEMQGFIDNEESEEIGELSFIYPEIKWNDLNLKDKTQYFQLLNQLHDKQLISSQTLLEEMDFKWDQEVKRMRYEQAQAGPMGMGAGLGGAAGGAGGMPLGGGGGGAGGPPMPGEGAPGMAGGVGGMDMGMGGGGMPGAMPATAGAGGKIMKPGKEKKFEQQKTDGQMMNAMPVKLTSIEQKVADTLVGLSQMYRINPQKIRVQFPVQNPHGGPPYQLDFALPDLKLNVECLLPGAVIETDNGYKKVEDVLSSDKLFDKYGKHTKIVHKFVQEYDGEVAKICAIGMFNLDVTSSHKLWISKPKKTRVVRDEPRITRTREYLQPDIPQFICVKEAEVGDYVIIPKRKTNSTSRIINLQQYITNNCKKIPEQINLDIKTSRLLGIYVAEGCASDSGSIVFSFSENEKDYINETETLMDEIFGIKLGKIYFGKGAARVYFQSTPLSKFFNEVCGKYARNKKVPSMMFNTSEENIKSFIQGVMDGDGCMRNESEWRIQTSSKSLALGIQQLCATIGIWAPIVISRIDGTYNIRGRSGIQHSLFEITINWNPRKRRYREDDDYFYIPIRKIIFSSYSGIRYNFETEDHSYCVNNMVSKNCDGDIWHSNPEQASDDQKRDNTLAQRGWTVLRFDDKAIEETPQAVRNTIGKFINAILESKKSKTASTDEFGAAKLYTAKSGEIYDLRDEYNKFVKTKFSGESFGGDAQQQESSFSKAKYTSVKSEEFKQ